MVGGLEILANFVVTLFALRGADVIARRHIRQRHRRPVTVLQEIAATTRQSNEMPEQPAPAPAASAAKSRFDGRNNFHAIIMAEFLQPCKTSSAAFNRLTASVVIVNANAAVVQDQIQIEPRLLDAVGNSETVRQQRAGEAVTGLSSVQPVTQPGGLVCHVRPPESCIPMPPHRWWQQRIGLVAAHWFSAQIERGRPGWRWPGVGLALATPADRAVAVQADVVARHQNECAVVAPGRCPAACGRPRIDW